MACCLILQGEKGTKGDPGPMGLPVSKKSGQRNEITKVLPFIWQVKIKKDFMDTQSG